MLTTEMEHCVENATFLAVRLGQKEVEVGHLVIAILEDANSAAALRSIGLAPTQALGPLLSHYAEEAGRCTDALGTAEGPSPSNDLKALIRVSVDYAAKRGLQGVTPLAFLWSVLRFNGGVPGQALSGLGITSRSLEPLISRQERVATLKAKTLPGAILEFCRDLVMESIDGRIDPVVGRDEQVTRCAGILRRRKKNNPILIGEPGVGKTAIVEGLAHLIAEGRAGFGMNDARILSLDVAKIIAGTRHRGDLEQRLRDIISHLEDDRSLILFIDETHVIVGGASGMTDASNLLKPALASGRIRCIGATTHGEYAKYFDADPALARRFQTVDVPEPSPEEAVAILDKSLDAYSRHHGVNYSDEAATAAVDLTARYVLTRKLPDKALDALDEAGVLASMRGEPTVMASHVSEVVSRMCGRRILGVGKTALEIRDAITSVVRGQDDACESVARLVSRSRSPLAASKGMTATILLSGGPGTGKELIARTMAGSLGLPVQYLDMSEYKQEHTVSRLIGPPPGYIGHGNGGRLTEAARRNPSCVLILDNMDAAHPDVHSIIAQAMRHGFLTDTSERIVSYRGVILVMIVSTEDTEGGSFGFTPQSRTDTDGNMTRLFSSGFLDLVDLTLDLKPIGRETLLRIAHDMYESLKNRLSAMGIRITVSSHVLEAIVDETLSYGTGARRMRRIFKGMVEDRLLDAAETEQIGHASSLHLTTEGVVVRQLHDQGAVTA